MTIAVEQVRANTVAAQVEVLYRYVVLLFGFVVLLKVVDHGGVTEAPMALPPSRSVSQPGSYCPSPPAIPVLYPVDTHPWTSFEVDEEGLAVLSMSFRRLS